MLNYFKSKYVYIGVAIFILVLLLTLFLLNASRVGPLEACPEECSQFSPQISDQIKILNLNLLHGYPKFDTLADRVELLAEQLDLLSPDIVTLQEVPWTSSTGSTVRYLAEKTGMNYVYLPANGNRQLIFFTEGEAILSKYPLKEIEYVELLPRAGFFEHRVALKATVVFPFRDLHVVSTHLTNGERIVNQAQARELAEFASAFKYGAVVVAGDFNAAEDTPEISDMEDGWIDTYRYTHPARSGFTCCLEPSTGSQKNSKPDKRIDYIFLSPAGERNIFITDSQLVFDHPFWNDGQQLWISDHLGILTTITFAP